MGGGSGSSGVRGNFSAVRWPVTAGNYIREVTNATGDVLSRYAFDAGKRVDQGLRQDEGKLRFVNDSAPFERTPT